MDTTKKSKTCMIEGCPNVFFAKTWCARHYTAWRKTGDPLGLEHERKRFRRGDAGRGRWHEEPDAEIDEARIKQNLCAVIGCERPYQCAGFCVMHYNRHRKYNRVGPVGSHKDVIESQKDEDGWSLRNGYKIRWTNSKNGIYQHREVYEQYLGRPLESFENIHHKNGDRADNRIENLEMWITTQPAGQRVEDLVAWAKEILERYDSI